MARAKHKTVLNVETGKREPDPQYERLVTRAVATLDQCEDDFTAFWDALDKLNTYVKLSQP